MSDGENTLCSRRRRRRHQQQRRWASGSLFLLTLCTSLAVVPALRFPTFGEKEQQPKENDAAAAAAGSNNNNNPDQEQQSAFHAMPPGSSTSSSGAAALWLSTMWDKGRLLLQDHIEMQRKTYQKMYWLVMYQPPVGIVTVYTLVQLVVTGRVFRLYHRKQSIVGSNGLNGNAGGSSSSGGGGGAGQNSGGGGMEGLMQDEHRKNKRRRNKGRALTLEERDQSYVSFGVIERVRGRLCIAALSDIVQQQEELHPSFAMDRAALFRKRRRIHEDNSTTISEEERLFQVPWIYGTALDALQISCPPGGSRYDYVDQVRETLSRLRAAEAASTDTMTTTFKNIGMPHIVQVATRVVEMRATDCMLRECRDQLLKTTYRLARTVKYWDRRVEQAKAMAVFQQSLIRDTIDGDRLRLSYAKAAYDAELDRLGRICAMLLLEKQQGGERASMGNRVVQQQQAGRPTEMQDSYLLRALKRSGYEHDDITTANSYNNHNQYPPSHYTRKDKKKWRSTWRLPKFSRYSIRMDRLFPKLIHLGKETYIDGSSAMEVLMEDDDDGLKEWYADATVWIKTSQTVLCEVLEDTLEGSVPTSADQDTRRQDLAMIRDAWNIGASAKYSGDQVLAMKTYDQTNRAWNRALGLVEDIRNFRRVGEGRSVGFQDLSIVGWFSGLDVFGVPSALSKIYLAHLVHTWAAPHWPMACTVVREAWETCVTIFLARFWEPGKDVVLDILNRGKSSMLDDFNLRNEERSLDVMLKDLKLGDGTAENRGKALEAATRQYETDLRNGLFRNVASGQLVRLLLVQVQQLKVGMLNAIEDIDVLISANKLNVRVLATIPAIIIITLGTRMFARNLYNLRSRDLRPISRVHDEMTEHLHRMKTILLLANGDTTTDNSKSEVSSKRNVVSSSVKMLGATELGEFALRMHCYLVLLDFCSPQPFPKSQCDAIHRSIQEVLGSLQRKGTDERDINVKTPVALVDIVIKKHSGLQKYL